MILEKDGPFDLLTRLTGAKGVVYIGQDSRLIQQLQSCFGETGCTIIQESVAPPKPPAQDEKPGSLTGTVFSDSVSVVPYYEASLPTYSGLIRPEGLQDYWQNLKTVKELEVETTTLDTYFVEADSNVAQLEAANWLFVDSLPSGRILGGAKHFLSSLDGVVLRAIKQKDPVEALQDSSLDFTTKALVDAGFALAHVEISRHSDFCHGIFVRDWKIACANQINAISQAAKTKRDNYESALVKRQQDIKTLDLARNMLSDKLDDTLASMEAKNQQIYDLSAAQTKADETESRLLRDNEALKANSLNAKRALETEATALKTDIATKEDQISGLNEQLKTTNETTRTLRQENEKLKANMSNLEDAKAKLAQTETTIDQLHKQKKEESDRYQEKVGEMASLISELRASELALKTQFENRDKACEQAETELQTLQKKIASLESQLKQACLNAETADQRKLLAENNLDDLRNKYKEMAQNCDDQAKHFALIQAELKGALELIRKEPISEPKSS